MENMNELINICEIIEDDTTGGALITVEVSQELLHSVFEEWFNNVIRKHAEEVLKEQKEEVNVES